MSDDLREAFSSERHRLDCVVIVIVEIDSLVGHVQSYTRSQQVCVEPSSSAINKTPSLAFVAERRRLQQGARSYRSTSPTRRALSSKPAGHTTYAYVRNYGTCSIFTIFTVHVTYGRGSVRLWRRLLRYVSYFGFHGGRHNYLHIMLHTEARRYGTQAASDVTASSSLLSIDGTDGQTDGRLTVTYTLLRLLCGQR